MTEGVRRGDQRLQPEHRSASRDADGELLPEAALAEVRGLDAVHARNAQRAGVVRQGDRAVVRLDPTRVAVA